MEAIFDGSTKTGEIVIKLPRASKVLKKYKIDFCCGGNRPIGQAILERNLDETQILNELNQLYNETQEAYQNEVDWEEKGYRELIEYIVNIHHSYLNQVLPELNQFVTKILRVHGAAHPELTRVHRLFSTLKTDLEEHLIQEEEIIFPMIKEYSDNPTPERLKEIVKAIQTLEQDHAASGQLLKELREVTHDYLIPEGACTTYRVTYLKLDELESDMYEHIHLENNILFPRLIEEANRIV